MTERDHLTAIIRDEEHGAAANAIQSRVQGIERLPDGPLRARPCAAAHLTGGYQLMQLMEGDAENARQLRRLAEMVEAGASVALTEITMGYIVTASSQCYWCVLTTLFPSAG